MRLCKTQKARPENSSPLFRASITAASRGSAMSSTKVYPSISALPRAGHPDHHQFQDLTGRVFSRLTVLHYAGKSECKHTLWACKCSCEAGSLIVACAGDLKNGKTNSCGCYRRDKTKEAVTTHGYSVGQAPDYLYRNYHQLLTRCYNKNDAAYPYYGGRGIEVKFSGPKEYVEWVRRELGERPEGSSLDRIDTNGHYEPGNLRWTTTKGQGRNKRSNHLVSYQGRDMTIAEASELSGIHPATISNRILRGYSDYEDLYTPIRSRTKAKLQQTNLSQIGQTSC